MAYIKHLKKGKNDVLIDAEFRIKCEKAIENFSASNQMVYEFPSTLTNVERAFVHNLAPRFNLKTKSNGFGENRRLSLYKLVEQEDFEFQNAQIDLNGRSKTILRDYFVKHPIRSAADAVTNQNASQSTSVHKNCPTIFRNPPNIPSRGHQNDVNIQRIRNSLPIFSYKDKILEIIDRNRVILVHGSTGSGKTTQLPQYLMDLAAQRGEPCRIVCTQPRRISAIASAERVCYERGIELGNAVGYQIRLDSKIQSQTNCVFLTPGVFLRYLMAMNPRQVFTNLTHCIIDEAHEHAKENDFLLTSIREHMDVNPNLKLIIMSATMDTAVFSNYFGDLCEEISIFSKQFEVEEFYLEDVLKMVNFSNKRVEELNRQYQSGEIIKASKSAYVNEENEEENGDCELDEETTSYVDEILEHMSTYENPESQFNQFFYLIQNENIPVNYRHSQTQMTALMIAVGRGIKTSIEHLISLKADPLMVVNFGGQGMNSIDMATQMFGENSEIGKILIKSQSTVCESNEEKYNKALVNIYQDTFFKSKSKNFVIEETIDHELIVQLIEKIHFNTDKNGAILIFLPGFDDIIQLSNLIHDKIRHGFSLFMLHSSMKTDDQKNVFKPTHQGKRKIILSTNIAESSITIDDVVYVIDSGREKQKSFDAISHSSSLRVQWISKASANQRRGRAGRLRNGIVYRIYSRDRYQSMLDVTIPELLRTSLSEVCLQTKLLISNSSCASSIEEFLLRCIAGPSLANIRQSIKYLQKLGALDEHENLTLLGSHLAHMPIDAKYGKMLIYAIIFKCVNPILSLVSILSMGDQIFLLPISPAERYKCITWRKTVADQSYSDHFMMLKIYQMWTHIKNTQQNERQFCEENFISRNHIENVRGIRKQILAYLEQAELIGKNETNLDENSENWSVLKAVICSGLYPFIARIERSKKGGSMYTEIDTKLSFHMSSVLYVKKEGYKSSIKKLPLDFTIFEEKNRVGRASMLKCNTLINSFTVALAAGNSLVEDEFKVPENNKSENGWDDDEWEDMHEDYEEKSKSYVKNTFDFKVDGLLKFSASNEDAKLIFDFKSQLNALISRFLSNQKSIKSAAENELVNAFANVLEIEEASSKMERMDVSEKSEEVQHFRKFNQNRQRNDNRQYQNIRQQQHQQHNPRNSNYQNQSHHNQQRSMDSRPGPSHNSRSFFPNNARHTPKPKLEMQQSSKRFFILKVNSRKFLDNLRIKSVVPLEELNLKIWQFHKIKSNVQRGAHVHIIFYSTHKAEFQGYGEVVAINENIPLQFNYRNQGTWRLSDLNMQNVDEIAQAVSEPSFFFHEIDQLSGNQLILYFQH